VEETIRDAMQERAGEVREDGLCSVEVVASEVEGGIIIRSLAVAIIIIKHYQGVTAHLQHGISHARLCIIVVIVRGDSPYLDKTTADNGKSVKSGGILTRTYRSVANNKGG